MLEEADALQRILATTPAPRAEQLPLLAADGRYLLEEVIATESLPGFDQSSMDGYALSAESLGQVGIELEVTDIQPAGENRQLRVSAGQAVRVFTGAAIPEGTAAVVMQEDVDSCGERRIRVRDAIGEGEFIRRRGEVVCRGQTVAHIGEPLQAGRIGLLATQGLEHVKVGGLPSCAVVSTGDELIAPGQELKSGQIYNSNSSMLSAAVTSVGLQPPHLGHAEDSLAGTVTALEQALDAAEVVFVAGGVSVGERDFVKSALDECGLDTQFWRVRMKPGKPFVYALGPDGRQVFGLPGNPVSALVGYMVLCTPALRKRMGAGIAEQGLRRLPARCEHALANEGERPHYLRGQLKAGGIFAVGNQQASHGILGLADADALLRLEAGQKVSEGEMVEVSVLI